MRKISLISFAIVIFLFLFVFKAGSALATVDCTISPSEIYDNVASQDFTITGEFLDPSNAPGKDGSPNGSVRVYFSDTDGYSGGNMFYSNTTGELGIAKDTNGWGNIYMVNNNDGDHSAHFDTAVLENYAGRPMYVRVMAKYNALAVCKSSDSMQVKVNHYTPPTDCHFTYTDLDRSGNISNLTQKLNIDVKGTSLVPTEKYSIGIEANQAAPLLKDIPWILLQRDISVSNGAISASWNFTEDKYVEPHHLQSGKQLKTTVYHGSDKVCSDSIDISGPPPQQEGLCTLNFNNRSSVINTFKPDDPIKFIANFPNVDNSTHRVFIQLVNENGNPYGDRLWDQCYGQSDLSSDSTPNNPAGIVTRTLPPDHKYYLQVNSQCAPWNESFSCGQKFKISENGGGLDGDPADIPQIQNFVKTPCSDYQKDAKGNSIGCNSVFSGLGVFLSTDPLELIPQILSVILGISGGIVILLIIRSGYKLMFSQGNPEKVQEAKDELTSAIVGLLFIIFSFVLLQFITNDLLKIQDLPKGEGLKTK